MTIKQIKADPRVDWFENVAGDGWCDESTKYEMALAWGWFFSDGSTVNRYSTVKEAVADLKDAEYNPTAEE